MSALQLPYPYLLFLGDTTEPAFAKTAFGLRDWAPERCIGEWGVRSTATVSTGLPRLSPKEARARGARGLVIGVANTGGVIGESWVPLLVEALEAGLDIVSGLHVKLDSVPALKAAAARYGRRLIDVRTPPPNIPCGYRTKRPGKRLLTVGTDCALGKKYSALAIARAFKARGLAVDFRATGQTGILISGGGMPMDAVVADFEAGAAELLSPAADSAHWDVIEGQGSLFHPAYAAVSLRTAARQPAGCHRRMSPAGARMRARPPGLRAAEHHRDDRPEPAAREAHQSCDSLRRRQPQHRALWICRQHVS